MVIDRDLPHGVDRINEVALVTKSPRLSRLCRLFRTRRFPLHVPAADRLSSSRLECPNDFYEALFLLTHSMVGGTVSTTWPGSHAGLPKRRRRSANTTWRALWR